MKATLPAPAMAWAPEDLSAFEKLVDNTSSRDQLTRISARLDMQKFIEQHGKEKCDVMFAELTKNDR